MGALQVDTAVTADGARLTAAISRDWEIWGPNGGYVSAIALRAAGAVAPGDHRPASLTVQYLGAGQFADAEAVVTPVKQGRSAWLLNVELRQEGKTFLQAQVWTTNRTEGPEVLEASMPSVSPPSALKTFAEHARAHYGDDAPPPPKFWTNLEAKPQSWKPFDAPREAAPAVLAEWYRFVGYEPGDVWLDQARAVVLIDTLTWPVHHRGRAEAPDYIAPTLELAVWFHAPAGDADWLLVEGVADVATGGLIHGRNRIWTEDGRLVATGGSNLLVTPLRR